MLAQRPDKDTVWYQWVSITVASQEEYYFMESGKSIAVLFYILQPPYYTTRKLRLSSCPLSVTWPISHGGIPENKRRKLISAEQQTGVLFLY